MEYEADDKTLQEAFLEADVVGAANQLRLSFEGGVTLFTFKVHVSPAVISATKNVRFAGSTFLDNRAILAASSGVSAKARRPI
jgi:hypothetical protein